MNMEYRQIEPKDKHKRIVVSRWNRRQEVTKIQKTEHTEIEPVTKIEADSCATAKAMPFGKSAPLPVDTSNFRTMPDETIESEESEGLKKDIDELCKKLSIMQQDASNRVSRKDMSERVLKLAEEMQQKFEAQREGQSADGEVSVQDPNAAVSSQSQQNLGKRTPRVERHSNDSWIEIVNKSIILFMGAWMQDKLEMEPGFVEAMATRESTIIALIDYKNADGNKYASWPYLSAAREYWSKVGSESPEEVLNSAMVAGIHITKEYQESLENLMELKRRNPNPKDSLIGVWTDTLTLPVDRHYAPPPTVLPMPFEQDSVAGSAVGGGVEVAGDLGAAESPRTQNEAQDTTAENEQQGEAPVEQDGSGAADIVDAPIEVDGADPGVLFLIHAMQEKMKERTEGPKGQVPKFYTRAVLEQLAKMSTNPIGAEFVYQWARMNPMQAAWYNNLSEEENIATVKIMDRIVLMEREQIGECPALIEKLRSMMKVTNLSMNEYLEYDVNEIANQNSKEFPATEHMDERDRTFWKDIQGTTPRPLSSAGRSYASLPPDLASGYFVWKRRRTDSEDVAEIKDFVNRNKCYNVRNPWKR